MNQIIKSRIEGHTLFPLVTQLVLCRHKVEVTTDAEELHTIVYNLHSLFENSFKNYHSNMRKSDSDTNDVDAQVDLVVKAAITILVTHILEITKQQENMDKMMEKMLADADNDFAMAVSSHLPSSMQPQQEPSQFQDTNSLSSSEQALINATQSLEPSCSSNSSFSSSGQNNVNGSSKSSQKGKISKRTKRSNHPPNAAKLLKEWLISHANDPYPSDQEKSMLAEITGLSIQQINHWFINARRRLLPKAGIQTQHQVQKQIAASVAAQNTSNNMADGNGSMVNMNAGYSRGLEAGMN